ncbi:MAG: hypothetical protein VZR33_05620 [Methanosphaera sp.]|nr:hypothetical protein [Methanosphaera sp.]
MAKVDVSKLIPEDLTKIDRNDFMTFLDTTPNAGSMNLEVLGIGITDYEISTNPDVESEKWIIEKNARNIHKSNQKQASAEQTMYKNDPCFEFARAGMDKLNYKTHIVDVDIWDEVTTGVYNATLSDGILVVTSYGGDEAKLNYDLYYNGDPIKGTVTFNASTGKAEFTATTSL